jgi:sporulation protein YlmC with PRC-barrel domain
MAIRMKPPFESSRRRVARSVPLNAAGIALARDRLSAEQPAAANFHLDEKEIVMILGKPLLLSFSLLAFAGAAYANEAAQSSASSQAAQSEQKAAGAGVSADGLLGATVTGSNGEALGEIEDIVLDVESNRVHAVVLDADGLNYAFPAAELSPGSEAGEYSLALDEQKLEEGENFAQNAWPAMDDDYWGRVGAQASAAAGGTQSAGEMALMRASEMLGVNLQDRSGNDVGEIKDIAVDLGTGSVAHMVIDLNEGGQATVEPGAIDPGTGGESIVLDMSAEQLVEKAERS